jgi:hypothetical protein
MLKRVCFMLVVGSFVSAWLLAYVDCTQAIVLSQTPARMKCGAQCCPGCCTVARRPLGSLGAMLCCQMNCDEPSEDVGSESGMHAEVVQSWIDPSPSEQADVAILPATGAPALEPIERFRTYKGLKIFLPDQSEAYLIHRSFLI